MKKLTMDGFSHQVLLPILTIFAVGAMGTYVLGFSHAATPPPPLSDWSTIKNNLTVVSNYFGTSLVGHNVCAYIDSILYHGYDPDPSGAPGHYHGLPASGAGALWANYPSLRHAANASSLIPAGAFVFYANTYGTVVHVAMATGYDTTTAHSGMDNDGYLTYVNGPSSPEKLWNYHIIGWMDPAQLMQYPYQHYGSYTSYGSATTYYNAFSNLKYDSSWR